MPIIPSHLSAVSALAWLWYDEREGGSRERRRREGKDRSGVGERERERERREVDFYKQTDAQKLAISLTSVEHKDLSSAVRHFEADMVKRASAVVKQGRFTIRMLLSSNLFWV